MRRLAIRIVAIVCAFNLSSCAMKSFAPPVTADLAPASSGQYSNIAMLREGRALFVHRCIECHTLPPFWHYRAEDWPKIVDSMSRRANLKPSERDAVIAYILAVRAQ
jgi:mono/diheme cytochrome c family protein